MKAFLVGPSTAERSDLDLLCADCLPPLRLLKADGVRATPHGIRGSGECCDGCGYVWDSYEDVRAGEPGYSMALDSMFGEGA
jgi:hypothetical protein